MTDVTRSGPRESGRNQVDVIRLDLDRAADRCETPQVELGSSHGTCQPGIERCIAELESRPTGPVHLELTLPQSEISDGLEERLAVTMRRFCDERSYVNDCNRRSTQ